MTYQPDVTVVAISEADEERFRLWWWRLAVTGGVVSIVLGLILLIWPSETLVVLSVLLGIWLLIAGVVRIAQAIFVPEGRSGGLRVVMAIGGLFYLVGGALCIRHPNFTVGVLAAIIGISWMIVGVVEIFAAFHRGVSGWYRVATITIGVVSVLGALVVLIWPGITLSVIIWLGGLWLLILGVIQVVMGIRASRAGAAPTPAPAT